MIQCNNLEVALPKIAWKIILVRVKTQGSHILIFIFEVMIFSVLNYDKQQ